MLEGAYTPMHIVSAEEKELFEQTMQTLIGVRYEPLIVSAQVDKGTNYRSICNASITASDQCYPAEVVSSSRCPAWASRF